MDGGKRVIEVDINVTSNDEEREEDGQHTDTSSKRLVAQCHHHLSRSSVKLGSFHFDGLIGGFRLLMLSIFPAQVVC